MRLFIRRLGNFYLRHEALLDAIGGGVTLLIMAYFGIGLLSLAQVAAGEDIPYMSFWHAPWKWALEGLASK